MLAVRIAILAALWLAVAAILYWTVEGWLADGTKVLAAFLAMVAASWVVKPLYRRWD